MHGAIPTILKYGDVFVQTAGSKEHFFFHEVPDPDLVRDIIIKLDHANKEKHKKEIEQEKIGDVAETDIGDQDKKKQA